MSKIYLDPKNNPVDYTKFAKTFSQSRKKMKWEEIGYGLKKTKYILQNNFLLQSQKVPQKIRILDVGCGNGRLIYEIQKLFQEQEYFYTGIDSSSRMLKEAYTLFPRYTFVREDMKNISCTTFDTHIQNKADHMFHMICFIASFHHLVTQEERIQVLKNMFSFLLPGGVIFLINWNLLGKKNFLKYKCMYQGNGDFQVKIGEYTRYYHGFTITELEEISQKTHYNIIENRIFTGERNIITLLSKK